MKFLQKSFSGVSRFIYETNVPDTVKSAPEPNEAEDLTPQQALEKAIWAVSKNPDGLAEVEALEALIQDQAALLADKLGDNAIEAFNAYAKGNSIEGSSLEISEIEGLAENITSSMENTEGLPLTETEQTEMEGMNNQEFLQKTPEARLRFVTKNNTESSAVASGTVESLEFTFTFNGRYNEALWHKTTAGQVLPAEVRSVSVGGNEFFREADSLSGEFFSVSGERLKIHEGTTLSAIKTGDLSEIQANIDKKLEDLKDLSAGEKLLAEFALEKGIDPKFAAAAFRKEGDVIETEDLPGGDKALTIEYKAKLESFLTNVDRAKDAFRDVSQQQNEDSTEYFTEIDGRVSPEFASFYMGFDNQAEARRVEVMTSAGYSIDEISASQSWLTKAQERANNSGYGGEMAEVSAEDLQGILENKDPAQLEAMFKTIRVYPPGSEIAQKLFTYAAMKANMGLTNEEIVAWGKSPGLHNILDNESKGKVGVLNYTLQKRGSTLAEVKAGKTRGARSSASGLGQCLYSNVLKYYPDGMDGIGDPLNEAVGMLRYIRDRYGSPEAARSVYGKTGTYVDGRTGRVRTKSFREGY